MPYGKHSIQQLIGAMLVTGSLSVGAIAVPTIVSPATASAANAVDSSSIDNMGNLLPAQRDYYKQQVEAAATDANAQEILEHATAVNDAAVPSPTEAQKSAAAALSITQIDLDALKAGNEQLGAQDSDLAAYYGPQRSWVTSNTPSLGDPLSSIANITNVATVTWDTYYQNKIGLLGNLLGSQKNTYTSAISSALDDTSKAAAVSGATKVNTAMGEENPETADTTPATDTDKAAAQAAIAGLAAQLQSMGVDLSATPYSYINDASPTIGQLAAAVKSAENAQVDDLKKQIDGFQYLTEEQKTYYKEKIDNPDSGRTRDKIFQGAKNSNISMNPNGDTSGFATEDTELEDYDAAKAALAKLTNLPSTDLADYNNGLDSHIPYGEMFPFLVRAIAQSKSIATNSINGLKNLTEDQKSSYLAAIGATPGAGTIVTIVSGATAVDTAMGASDPKSSGTDLATDADIAAAQAALKKLGFTTTDDYYQQVSAPNVTAGDVAQALIDATRNTTIAKFNQLKNLTDEQRESYKSQVKDVDALTAPKILESATNVDSVMGGNLSAATAKTDADVTAATAAINALSSLDDTARQNYITALGTNTSQADVVNTVLNAVKDDKTAAKNSIDELTKLTPEQKTSYKSAVDAANGGEAIKTLLSSASTIDAVMGENPSDEQKTAATGALKTTADVAAATAAIDALSNLDANTRKGFTDKLATNSTEADVAATVLEALDAAKSAAKKSIDALTNLTLDQKSSYKDSVDSAIGAAAINAVVTSASTIDAVMGENPSDEQKTAATGALKTTADVAAATAAIDALSNLDADTRKGFTDKLATNGTEADVATTVLEALDAAKKAAKESVGTLSSLTDEQKKSYEDQIDNAKSGTTVASAIDGATRQNAKNQIDPLKNLSDEEKATVKKQIDEAELTNLDSLLASAKNTNTSRFTDALAKAKDALTQAKAQYDQVRYTNASADAKKAFEDRVAALTSLIASADETNGMDNVTAADLTTASNNLTAASDALDGVEQHSINWLPILLGVGALGVGGAIWYVLNNQPATPEPTVPPAPAPTATPEPSREPAPAPAPAPVAAPAKGTLAITGAQVRGIAVLAMVLIALGGAFTLRRRRER
ncbi:MAG: GA module-containing protein [Corynebacterium sp.]|nr:GA module-containing protein [Corynebacterium sp.]